MASPSTSSPSSSAVIIPRPGKSILKKAPPPQQSFFSFYRLSRLLPTQNQASSSSTGDPDENLKRAHFFLPHLATVYPISAASPPCSVVAKEEKKTIEAREAERRRRIVRGNSFGPGGSGSDDWWSMDKVESFYQECCVGREEQAHPGVSAALKKASATPQGRSLDLSGVQITLGQAATLSDVFSVEWGLRKLFLKECDLDEHNLKPILHSLLIPGTLNFLSVASNRRLKAGAFKLIGAFVQKSKNLQFLDLSQNALDKKSVEYIGMALRPSSEPGLVSLRMDDCSLRPASLESLAQNVRTSSLRNISLRHNRISASGAVALALMIKDYPDTMPIGVSLPNGSASSSPSSLNSNSSYLFGTLSPPGTPNGDTPPLTPTQSVQQLSPIPSPRSSMILPPPPRQVPIPPPPTHPANLALQPTYTPYIPRARRAAALAAGATAGARAVQHATRAPDPLSASGQQVPIITSSAQGGITTRHPPGSTPSGNSAKIDGPSAALLDKVRALDALPRLGELRTLDLRGNDVRTGITYIAQVLKRNRTLKVLNLCENKIDIQGLVAIAEALKYNLTLETLDLSRNPCSGPSLEGIQSLRTAFTLNTSLKRLFLSSTSMTSAGAIALAEFLPESTSLLHLDLTKNNLDLAAVMALSGGLKANHTMRCLDLNIPPDDEEFARMCRDILNTCVRNTEEAERNSQAASSGRGLGKGVWGMIEESELAKTFKKDDEKKVDEDLVSQAKECLSQLQKLSDRIQTSPRDYDTAASELVDRAKAALVVLADVIQATTDPIRIEELFFLNDNITNALTEIDEARKGGVSVAPVANGRGTPSANIDQASTGVGLGLGLIFPSKDTEHETEHATNIDEQAAKTDVKMNGLRLHIPAGPLNEPEETESGAGSEVETPRIDKGKGRAAPEPEVIEKVLSPSFVLSSSDDEDEDEDEKRDEEEQGIPGRSPTDLSKVMVEEEGEVFRKGNVLLGPDEMEGEYDGEELRLELLEAEVERPPPRALHLDEFGMELPPLPASPQTPNDAEKMLSPTGVLSPTSPHEQTKPPPRPYLRRSRSASSVGSPSSTSSPRLTESMIKGGSMPEFCVAPATPSGLLSPTSPGNGNGNGQAHLPYLARHLSSSTNSSASSSPVLE